MGEYLPKEVTKGRAQIWWDSVVEKVWKDTGGNQGEMMSAGKFGIFQAEADERTERRETLALRSKEESERVTPRKGLHVSGQRFLTN